MPTNAILCPVDFSEQSRQALLWAAGIARYRHAELTVLSVVEPLLAQAAGIRLGIDLKRTEVEPALCEFVVGTLPDAARSASPVRMEVATGSPAEAILDTARRLSPLLIALGTHGLGGIQKALFGSTTMRVLRHTEWPVLAVPAGAASAPGAKDAAVRLRKILLATDFRESAAAAAQWAGELASSLRVPLVLAHVVEPALPTTRRAFGADVEREHVAAGERQLAQLSDSVRDTRSDRIVAVGSPAETIALLATTQQADLVVMGLANPDKDPGTPGSIAYEVVRAAHVAVAVVPRSSVTLPSTSH